MLHSPLTLFHASFLPICSTFSHLSLLILHHYFPTHTHPHPRFSLKSKIRKRSWVLHECVERVPENVDAAKELLQYGLKGTDLEALIAIGNGEDRGRWGIMNQCAFHKSGTSFCESASHFLATLPLISVHPPRFIIPGDVDIDDLPYEDFLSQDEELERKKEREGRRRGELLAKVNFSRYTGGQSPASFIHGDTR